MKNLLYLILAIIMVPAHADTEFKSCMDRGETYYNCTRKLETPIISRITSGLVERDGKNLILKTVKKVNPDKVLIDTHLQYSVKAHYPEHQISLISETGWEHFTAYIYHHKYGAYREVFDEIKFSSDGHFLVAFGADIEAGFTPNAVAVYRIGDWPTLMSHFLLE